MHFVLHFLSQFLQEEKYRISAIVLSSICINIVQTKGISETSSKLIDAVHHNRKASGVMTLFYVYSGLLFFLLVLYYIFYELENQV